MELYFPLILDGATGTQLQLRGFTGRQCTEQWVLEHPDAILDLQGKYADAGSQVVYAPTFSANRVKLEENGIFNQVADYNTRLIGIAKQAVGDRALVAADIAPTGKFLAPLGDVSFEELVDIYTEQVAAQEAAGADLFVIETMMTVSDARAAVLACRSVSRKPILVSFTCNEKGRTITGCDAAAVLVTLQGMGVDAFGLNCSVGPEDMVKTIRHLAEYAEIPLIAKPNAGLPEIVDGKTVYNCPPEEFIAHVRELAEAGVCLFGGCCGTGPEHIRALKESLQGVTMHRPAPQHRDMLVAATEKEVFLLPRDIAIGTPLPCNAELADAVENAAESDAAVIAVRLTSTDELDDFADAQVSITKPLCLVCEDATLLEQTLRLYQGRALYEGNLPENVLEPLSRKYGLIY